MKFVYTSYFQKSKVFLYPLLNLKKGMEFVPADTYICWDKLYSTEDNKFICVYNSERTESFENFEFKSLKFHPMLEFSCGILDKQIYIFDMGSYKYDFRMFVKGYYSKFSDDSKTKILNYFGNKSRISEYVLSFLNPKEYHDVYAEKLGVAINIIKGVHEICSKPDLEKETMYEIIPEILELFKNNTIPLTKI